MALTDLDRNLILRCLAKEPGAWRDFVDRFGGLFAHVIQHTSHTRSAPLTPDDVDDLCSEIFLAILADDFAVLQRFRGDSSLATYLTVIARRVVVRELSQRRMSEAMGHVRAHHDSLEQAQIDVRIENREIVLQMLDGLPDLEAAVLQQFHLEGRSYHDISRALNIPENSIGPMLSRAREKLRRTGLAVN